MESPTPVAEETVVVIAVNKSKHSQSIVKWAVENLLMEGYSVTLLHIRPNVKPFDHAMSDTHGFRVAGGGCSDLSKTIVDGYKDIVDMQARERLLPIQSYLKKKKIQNEVVIVEDNDLVNGIADYLLTRHVDVLIVGAGTQNGILKKLKGPDVATRVSKKAPYFCTVYTIAKGRLLSVRSSTAQAVSGNNVKNPEQESSYDEPRIGGKLTYNGSSVNSRTTLLPHVPEKEFEFRSPLQNYGHSDFRVGGLEESESDISYVSSDRQFYNDSYSSYSNNSSNCRSGSFISSFASSNSSNWDLSSFESSTEDSVFNSMDELQKLRFELIKSKNKYDSVCNEEPDAKMLSSNRTSLNLDEDTETEKFHRSVYQPTITDNTHGKLQRDVRPNQKPPRPAFFNAPK